MKKVDKILFSTALLLLIGLLLYIDGIIILRIAICLIIIGIFFYWKLVPYKSQLYPKYAQIMDSVAVVITPLIQLLNKLPNVKLGDKLFVDTRYLLLCTILLFLLVLL